jgi:hypothetical protein
MTKRVSLHNEPDELLWRRAVVARKLNISPWTLDAWVRRGVVPRPITMVVGGPQCWKPADILAAIEKAKRARRPPRPPRGRLRRGAE